MFFVTGDAITRAHHSTIFAAALAHAHAAQRGMRQAALISGELKSRLRLPRGEVRAEPEILVKLVRLASCRRDDFARIHLPIRIPRGLELAECLHQFRPKHFRKEFGARLSISMFAGE